MLNMAVSKKVKTIEFEVDQFEKIPGETTWQLTNTNEKTCQKLKEVPFLSGRAYTKNVRERLQVAKRLFEKFDQDKNGFLSEDEIP